METNDRVEALADRIHNTFASAYAINESVSHEWLKNVIKEAFTTNERVGREEVIKDFKEAFYQEFAGAGELWFPYIDCGAKDRNEELEAVDEHWNSIYETFQSPEDKQ